MKVAVILGFPAILADGNLYWFGWPKDFTTELAAKLAEHLRVPLVMTAYMPPVERAALAAWARNVVIRVRDVHMPSEQWWALEDCLTRLWSMQREATRDIAHA